MASRSGTVGPIARTRRPTPWRARLRSARKSRVTAGSDAHLPEEIGNGVVTLEVDALTLPAVRAALLRGATAVDGRRGKARYVAESQLTKRRRTHAGAAAYAKWALFAAKCCLQDITWKEETYHVLDR